jgi:hypothetical protein
MKYIVRSPVNLDALICVALCGPGLEEIVFVAHGATVPSELASRRELVDPCEIPEAVDILATIAEISCDKRLNEITSAMREEVCHLGADASRGEADAWVLVFLVPILRALIRRARDEAAIIAKVREGATVLYSSIGSFLGFAKEPRWLSGEATRLVAARRYAGVVAEGVIEIFDASRVVHVPVDFTAEGVRGRFTAHAEMTNEQIVRAWDKCWLHAASDPTTARTR